MAPQKRRCHQAGARLSAGRPLRAIAGKRDAQVTPRGHSVLVFLRNVRVLTLVLQAPKFNMLRAAVRPATVAARSVKPANVSRTLSMSAIRRSGEHHDNHHHESPIPSLFPPGSKPGEVPTDLTHATGLERLQVLGEAEGVKVFDFEPLDASRVGTTENPIKVFSFVSISSFLLSRKHI